MSDEQWAPIPGYKGLYEVSTKGRVWSNRMNKIMAQAPHKQGYLSVTLKKAKKAKYWLVHRLVLLSFCGRSKLQCNHKNGKKNDNRLENLEYCTPKQNIQHAHAFGLKSSLKGKDHPGAKLTEFDVKVIRELLLPVLSAKEVSEMYKVARHTISDIHYKRTWRHL